MTIDDLRKWEPEICAWLRIGGSLLDASIDRLCLFAALSTLFSGLVQNTDSRELSRLHATRSDLYRRLFEKELELLRIRAMRDQQKEPEHGKPAR